MKKRLESELISIAHRILKLKNKSEIDQLYRETQKLYETLTVLKFYGDNFEQVKATVSNEELEVKIENSLNDKSTNDNLKIAIDDSVSSDESNSTSIENVVPSDEKIEITSQENSEIVEEEIISEVKSEINLEEESTSKTEEEIEITTDEKASEEEDLNKNLLDDTLDFEPIFELAAETPVEENEPQVVEEIVFEPKKQEPKQISFEDLLGQNYTEPIFDKPSNTVTSSPKIVKQEVVKEAAIEVEKTVSLYEKSVGVINVGLNDRVAFVKNLFSDSTEDYNRVISQLNTFDTLQEAQEFIEDMVKPDYNNWTGKEEYEERFMEIVAKKFA